jgi:hypothetical protein
MDFLQHCLGKRGGGGGKHYTHKAPIPLTIGFYYLKLISNVIKNGNGFPFWVLWL